MKLTARKPSPRSPCRPARPIILNGTRGCPVSDTGCASPLAARSIAHGRCSIVTAVPPGGMLLGSAAVLGAEQARVLAKKALGKVANGTDPQADRQDRRDKDKSTLRSVVADYLAIKQRDVRARTHVEQTRYLTDKRYFGPLHGYALDQITRADVAARLNRISLESSPIVAARARAQLSALFSWALTQGLTEANPVVGTAQPRGGQPRERVLSDAELAAHLEGVRRRRSWPLHQAPDPDRGETAGDRRHVLERV